MSKDFQNSVWKKINQSYGKPLDKSVFKNHIRDEIKKTVKQENYRPN